MRLLINLENTDEIRELYIETHDTLETLKYIIEAEFQIPFSQQDLKYQGKPLTGDNSMISTFNLPEDEILVLSKKAFPMPTLSSNTQVQGQANTGVSLSQIFDNTMKMINTQPNNQLNYREMQVKSECIRIKQQYLNNPGDLSILFMQDREMAELIVAGDDLGLEALIRTRLNKFHDKEKEKRDIRERAKNNPNDLDAKAKLEEIENLEKIDENYKLAQEYFPESFSHIHMLFINLEINRLKVTALVDTGAQMTIISEDLAKKAGIFHLCDKRFQGMAKGVGTSKIIGHIHAAQLKVGDK
jgi:DNA damage-inducible protein 1